MGNTEYEFNIGDAVIDNYGTRGVIIDISEYGRGRFDLKWEDENGLIRFITQFEVKFRCPSYHKIGKYQFSPLRSSLF